MTKLNLFTTLAAVLLSISAMATPIPGANIGGFDFIYNGEFFTSEDNLSGVGNDTDPLPTGDNYTSFTNLLELGYSFRPAFRISLGGELNYASSEMLLENRSNSEFSNAILSAQYFWGSGPFKIIPNLRASIATNEIEIGQDEVLTSEGSSRYEFGSWLRYPLWVLDSYLYVSYIYQDDEKADLLNWALGTKWSFSRWILRGQVNGVSTIKDDAQLDFVRHSVNNSTSAGSLRFNSINPSYIEFDTIVEYQVTKDTRFGGGFGHTITGKNYGFGPSVFLSFTTEFRTDSDSIDDSKRLDGSGRFEPELEEYNEDLFR